MLFTYRQLAEITGKHINTIRNKLNGSTLTYRDLGPGRPKLWKSAEALPVIYAETKSKGDQK